MGHRGPTYVLSDFLKRRGLDSLKPFRKLAITLNPQVLGGYPHARAKLFTNMLFYGQKFIKIHNIWCSGAIYR